MPGKLIRSLFLALVASTLAFSVQAQTAQFPATPAPAAPQAPGQPAQPNTQAPEPARNVLAVVVLDPAHGGADPGAHGASGILESDVVLSYARLLRISLEAQGLRVILTRQANEDPSVDDRSKTLNAQRGAIFITLHVSSTGLPGTVRVYSLPQDAGVTSAPHGGLVRWDRAQANFIDQSRKLAELIQIQMAQRFHGSPEVPLTAPVRQLRTVAAPAVAVEVSSVSLPDRAPLDQMGPGIADGVARAVAAFRTIYEGGGK